MKLKNKIIIAFLFVTFLVSLVGFIGLYANNQIVFSYNEGNKFFEPILTASNEASSFAKRAQGHTFLYLTLNNRTDRNKVYNRLKSLREQIAIMDARIKNPEAKALLNNSKLKTDEMQYVIEELFRSYDNEINETGSFNFTRHEALFRKLDDLSSELRRNGLELGQIEIRLRQEHDAASEQKAFYLHNIILIINIIALISVFTIWIAVDRNITDPLNMLKRGIQRIKEGNFDEKIEILSNDEISDLSDEFNMMSSDLKRSSEIIRSSNEFLENIIISMNEALIITSVDCRINKVNAAVCRMLGYDENELIGQHISKIILNTDCTSIDADSCCSIAKNSNIETEMISKDSLKIPVILSNSIMSVNNVITGIIYIAHDITERKKDEAQIRKSLLEKEVLLKEIHHRVKNNMQIISSLLDHQMVILKDTHSREIMNESKNRIYSMSLVHEKLYQSKDLRNINFKDYISDLAINLFQNFDNAFGNIRLNLDIEEISMDIDLAVPAGLILNELVTNSIKYAFPDSRKGEINITFRELENDMLELIVSDNGIGIKKDIDFKKTKSLGLHLVTILSENQLHGTIEHNRDKGTSFRIRFKRNK